jgi:hypothetical protein
MRALEVVNAEETGWFTELSTTAPQTAMMSAAAQAARKARIGFPPKPNIFQHYERRPERFKRKSLFAKRPCQLRNNGRTGIRRILARRSERAATEWLDRLR